MATGHQEEIAEERRLLYVAMTRAKQHLHLLVPQRFYITQQTPYGDRHLYGSLSRFIPPEVAACFESIGPSVALAAEQVSAAAPLKTIDVAAQVRSLWG
jgi:DNA helicase-2/ATP-dependent DNA helicase PcrA